MLATTRDVWLRPQVAFPGGPAVTPALLYTTTCGLALGAVVVCLSGLLLGSPAYRPVGITLLHDPTSGALTLLILGLGPAALLLLLTWIQSISFTLGLLAVGRPRGARRYATRACAYAQGILAPLLAASSTSAVSTELVSSDDLVRYIGLAAWGLEAVLWPTLTGRLCWRAGRGLGLSATRATVAAAGPTLLCLVVTAFQIHQHLILLR